MRSATRCWTGCALIQRLIIAVVILSSRWRIGVIGAFVFALFGAVYLLVLRVLGLDLELCGCFGSKRVGLVPHLAMLLGIMLLSLIAWRKAHSTSPHYP